MRYSVSLLLAFMFCCISVFACKKVPTKKDPIRIQENDNVKNEILKEDSIPSNNFTDPRDGEVYKTITIGNQTWFAENLRYNAVASRFNLESPDINYGRMYEVGVLHDACPKGWHMPTDSEWDDLEIAHGMPVSFVDKGGWRGEHAPQMRAINIWNEDLISTDSLGFNVIPAGYFFSEKVMDKAGFEGLGYSAAFWSYDEIENKAMARFMFSGKAFVNKWKEEDHQSGTALSCRCILNKQ